MKVNKSINLVDILTTEVALEGLDGITLEALWQRLAVRLEESLPLKRGFMEQIWKLCLEIHDFSFFKLKNPRENLIIFDRYELEYLNTELDKQYEQKDIYEHCPIEDKNLGIRGSCATYHTRKNIDDEVKSLSLFEAEEKFQQKLVIVASQSLREQALIDDDINPTLQLPILHYCLLERIGRSRYLGDITIKKTSGIKEDAKTMFYIRKGLLEHGLIRKQVYYQGNTGNSYTGQNMGTLVHLTRFFNTRKPKVIAWAEHLIDYLKSRENYAAEYNEVKNELNLDYSIKKFFKIHILQKVFRTDVKVPYRSYFPNCLEKDWQTKSNSSKERIVKLVTLADPNIEISDLWRTEEVKEEDSGHCILDISRQKLNVPFLRQAYDVIEESGWRGISQMELASKLGFTKLISRTIVRNLVKTKVVSTYIDDIGRQRTTKFVSRKWDNENAIKKRMEEEISKMKEYSKSVKIKKSKEKSTESTKNNDAYCDPVVENSFLETVPSSLPDESYNKSKSNLFFTVNQILGKYKLFNNKNRYQYTSSSSLNKLNNKIYEGLHFKKSFQKKQSDTFNSNSSEPDLLESDFYKTIETKLIVQKPECKKKSQKVAVVGIMENLDNTDMSLNVSFRLIHRANMVIESIKQHKVIEDTQKLMKYINSEEIKEGLDARIDKNSLIRLLQKLAEDNLIKNIKLILKNKKQTKQKIINFICDPSIDINDALIQSAVEQAKLKFCMSATSHNPLLNSNDQISAFNKFTPIYKRPYFTSLTNHGIQRNSYIARQYGYCPKFVRMKQLHIFLYYLIYDNPEKMVSKTDFLEILKKQEITIDDALKNIPHLYSKEVDWKMFIPPLPKHRDFPVGWALMADIHLRMPLSLFVKVININFEIPGLQEILEHPIKRHYLMKDIPTPIRNLLFLKRKYIFSIHEIVTRLCYLGLLQFGPQKLKEKDQVFIYLNRNTELLDTTSSSAGYHRIEDKPYPATKFIFSSMAMVENYWYEMWNICINTDLGGRLVVEGKDILLEDLARKIEMIQATKVRTPEEAEKYDTGFVPGDRKGAAGIDSAFFAHLKRNWNWISGTTQIKSFTNKLVKSQVIKPSKSVFSDREKNTDRETKLIQFKKRNNLLKAENISSEKMATFSKTNLKPRCDKTTGKLNVPVFPQATSSKPPKIVRKVLPRKQKRRRVKYDEIDFSALQRMDKLRVDWEQHEDNILLVCKVAMMYLCPNPRRNIITFTSIRDILREFTFTSLNKTSKACQRRLLYMLKQPKTLNSVFLAVEEVKQDFYVNKRFGGIIDKIRAQYANLSECEEQVEKVFKDLVGYIARKYYNISNMEYREPIVLPKTIQEFNLYYQLKLPIRTIKTPGVSKEVHEVTDIHTCTINSVIHSSMCCGKERRSWAYQLFKVYQQYPEYLLRNAMLKIRADKMVTMKKSYMCANKKFGNCMPMSSSQYQLSSSYYYKFQTKWPYQLFSETYNILLMLLENYIERKLQGDKFIDGIEVKPDDGGIVAMVHDYLGTDILDVDIEIPEQIIMLDPGLPQKHEVYQRIAVRYQAILDALGITITTGKDSQSQEEVRLENLINQTSDNKSGFVQVHSVKKPLEDDRDSSHIKKRKLDNNEISPTVDLQNIKDIMEKESTNQEIQTIIKGNSKKSDTLLSKQVDSKLESANTSTSLQNFSNDWLEGFQNTTSSNLSTENVRKHLQISGDSIKMRSNTAEKELECESVSATLPPSNDSVCDSEATKASSTRVNQLVKRAKIDSNSTMIENLETRNDVQDARTKQTRIAMLQMREELHDLAIEDNHHAYEYFVVNSFKLLYSLVTNEQEDQNTTVFQGMELPKKLLPLDIELVNKILSDIKAHAVFPKETISLDDFKSEFKQKYSKLFQWPDIEAVYKFIRNKVEFGATLHELAKEFDYLNKKLAEILVLMTEKRIVLRAGIVTVRYIHHRYINPWIIHSYKILRLEKEAHQTIPEGSVYVLDGDENNSDKDKETNRVYNAANLFYAPPLKSLNNGYLNVNKKNNDPESDSTIDTDKQCDRSISKKRKNNEDDISERKKRKINSGADNLNISEQIDTNSLNKSNINDEPLEVTEINATSTTCNQTNLSTDTNENLPNKEKNATNGKDSEISKEISDCVSESSEGQRRLRRKKTLLLKQKDVYRAAKLLDFNTAEEIKVVIKPWIRIDGVLNRRVLDRMLGAVLCYCIEKPGLSLTAVQNRFSPAVQPYHTRELVEILAKLGCVKTVVQKVPKVTLFSNPRKIDFSGNPDLIANSDNYIIEPTTQCALKFGMFLSNRSYSFDFLSTL